MYFALTAQELHVWRLLDIWTGIIILQSFGFFSIKQSLESFVLHPLMMNQTLKELCRHRSGGRCCIRCSLLLNLICANCLQALQAASPAQYHKEQCTDHR